MMLSNFAARAGLVAAALMALITLTGAPAHAADNQDRHVRIVNNTGVTIREFYASNVNTDDWEEDILGQDVLLSGRTVNVNIDDGSGACRFDFKAVLSDGREIIRNNINVCQISQYVFSAADAGRGARGGDGHDRHVRIFNDTRETMREFYASNINTSDWEEDILGQDVLRAGQSVNINIDDGTGACRFDFKAVFASGREIVRHDVNVCQVSEYRFSGDAGTQGSNDGQDRRVRIYNDTSLTMREFYASNVDTSDWEEDILGQDVLNAGQSVTINIDDGTGACRYDFKAVFSDGHAVVKNNINVCQVSEYRFQDAGSSANDGQDRHVVIINGTRRTMREFYASNVDTDDWEEDILGQDVLRPGQRVRVNIDDGTGHCNYDFKAVFSDGTQIVRNNMNVCQLTEYRFTDGR